MTQNQCSQHMLIHHLQKCAHKFSLIVVRCAEWIETTSSQFFPNWKAHSNKKQIKWREMKVRRNASCWDWGSFSAFWQEVNGTESCMLHSASVTSEYVPWHNRSHCTVVFRTFQHFRHTATLLRSLQYLTHSDKKAGQSCPDIYNFFGIFRPPDITLLNKQAADHDHSEGGHPYQLNTDAHHHLWLTCNFKTNK